MSSSEENFDDSDLDATYIPDPSESENKSTSENTSSEEGASVPNDEGNYEYYIIIHLQESGIELVFLLEVPAIPAGLLLGKKVMVKSVLPKLAG